MWTRFLVAAWLLLGGCPDAEPPPATPVVASDPESGVPHDAARDDDSDDQGDAVAKRATELVAQASAAEPSVTPLLLETARELGGEMIKLEHRLKTRASTERKLRLQLAEPLAPPLSAIVLDDLLRYTMRIEDQPPGHYMQAIGHALERLEAVHHRVVRVKNYWPANDSYSGLHVVLSTRAGLVWELQFHTADSLAVQARTRDLYEELRRSETPLARKRQLFEEMTKAWNEVPIPSGAIDPAKNPPETEIIERPAP